jgi:hypothetical protein
MVEVRGVPSRAGSPEYLESYSSILTKATCSPQLLGECLADVKVTKIDPLAEANTYSLIFGSYDGTDESHDSLTDEGRQLPPCLGKKS